MKFSQNFQLFQVPEWESFYISYDLLKRLFSAATKNDPLKTAPNFTELHACLSSNIEMLNTFRSRKYEFLHRKETELRQRYGIELYLSAIPALDEVDDHELEVLFEAFTELRRDLTKLRWYDRVNQDAIHRIYAKLERFSKTIGPSHYDHRSTWIDSQLDWETQSLKDVERFNNLVTDISRAQSTVQSGSPLRSLCLKNVCDSHALAYPSTEYHAIRDNVPSILTRLLDQKNLVNDTPSSGLEALLSGLLEFSMTCQSRGCTDILLSANLNNVGDVIDHNFLNHLIAVSGRSSMPAYRGNSECRTQGPADHSNTKNGVGRLFQALGQLGPSQRSVLQITDTFGRLPLHYAARYGLTAICQSILESLHDFKQGTSAVREAVLSKDSEGYTPLYSGVSRNHSAVTRLFLETLEVGYQTSDQAKDEHLRSVLSDLLLLALRSRYDDIVHLLISSHININHQSSRGETALYIAAKIGREDYVNTILKASPNQAVIDIFETVNGWTPLFVACARGHLEIVELLLNAGASQTILDHRGWTAKQHAAFRGHLAVASILEDYFTGESSGGTASKYINIAIGATNRLRDGYSHIIVNLGTMQEGKQVTAVDLSCCSSEFSLSLEADTRFSIEVSIHGGSGSSGLVQLPILDDMVNDPFIFRTKNLSKVQLVFSIFCATPVEGKKGILVGSGTALLESDKNQFFGAQRESLIRELSVPILERETLKVMGTVTFTFVIAKPFIHLDTPSIINPFKDEGQIQLVGHRGLGQNTTSRKHLQLGENTIESFLSAARLGASFVEFDVQLTRDLVPVIYHDFSLSESGTDIPIHDLNFQQFMYASNVQSPKGNSISVLGGPILQTARGQTGRGRPRSRSLTSDRERGADDVQDRMKPTVDFMKKGFKPNTRGDFIQDSFATLEELLIEMPETISFNIEIKYPRLHEAVDAGVAPVAIDLNTFIDASLDKIYRFGGNRTIILSSFTPEVCILLALKQQAYHVMLITNAGKQPVTDKELRGGSLQVAVRFAKQWNLAGVVFAAETLLLCPRLVKYVQNLGLICASYGLENNIPENAKMQAAAGLDMIMADRVGLVAKSLELHPYDKVGL